MLKYTIYTDRDNEILLVPYIEGSSFSPEDITRAIIQFYNSDGDPPYEVDSNSTVRVDAFSFGETVGYAMDTATPMLGLILGEENIPERDDYLAKFIFYTGEFPQGIVWDEEISFAVKGT